MNKFNFLSVISIPTAAFFTLFTSESANADQVINDDLIVQEHACIGRDCRDGVDLDFTTMVLKENNIRILFDDTSNLSNFARNDWGIEINGRGNNASNYFAIVDRTSNQTLFRLCAVADTNCQNIVPATASPQIGTNTTNITNNANNISTNTNNITTNTNNISTNANNISTNANNITTNANNIATNTNNIATNTNDIATNANNISTNTNNIATNTNNIATNTNDIATNAANIAAFTNNSTNNAAKFASLGSQVRTNKDGIALAMALGGGAPLLEEQNGSVTLNYGNFDGADALGVIGNFRLNDHFVVGAAVGTGFNTGSVGGRIGITAAW